MPHAAPARLWRQAEQLALLVFAVFLLLAALAPAPARAQVTQLRDAQGHPYTAALGYDSVTGLSCVPGPAAPTCVGATGSGPASTSLTPWTKDAGAAVTIAPTAATGAQDRGALPGAGTTIEVTNNGTVEIECLQGNSSVQATTGDTQILPGQSKLFAGAAGITHVSCITPGGTGSARIVSGTGDPRTAIQSNLAAPQAVNGPDASGAAPTQPPVYQGCLAKTALPTAVADGQVVGDLCDKYGRKISPAIMRENKGAQQTDISGTSETTIVTADATNKLELYCLILANTNTTNPATATIKDATGGTTRAKFQIPAGETRGFCVAADSGLPQAAANTNWTATLAGTSPTVSVTAGYMKAGS